MQKSLDEHLLDCNLNELKTTELLPFVIKTYKNTANDGFFSLASNIKLAQNESIFKISGPFGRGLELHEDIQGDFVIISAGTGILPFVDLLDFLLKKAIWMAAVADGKETLKNNVVPQQDYERIFKDATFYFYGAFSSEEDYCIKNLIQTLDEICQNYNFTFFYYKVQLRMHHNNEHQHLRAKTRKEVPYYNKKEWQRTNNIKPELKKEQPENNLSTIHQHKIIFDSPGLKSAPHIGLSSSKITNTHVRFDDVKFLQDYVPKGARVYICGPREMTKSVYNNLRGLGFDDYKLVLI